jgi:hypothetical protein
MLSDLHASRDALVSRWRDLMLEREVGYVRDDADAEIAAIELKLASVREQISALEASGQRAMASSG